MEAAGPTRSFRTPEEGLLVTEELPVVSTSRQDYFTNYAKAYRGEEAFMIKIEETRRVLRLMEEIREYAGF